MKIIINYVSDVIRYEYMRDVSFIPFISQFQQYESYEKKSELNIEEIKKFINIST